MEFISDTKHDCKATFFVTTGRGTEKFAEEEIKDKLNCPVVQKRDGKIFFTVPYSQLRRKNVFALKSVERIFVAITDYKNINFIKDKRSFLNQFMCELSACHNFINAQKVIDELKFCFNSSHSTCSKCCNKGHNCVDKCYCHEQNSLRDLILSSQMLHSEHATSCASTSEISIHEQASFLEMPLIGPAPSSEKATSGHPPSLKLSSHASSSEIPNVALSSKSPPLKKRKLSHCESSTLDSESEAVSLPKQKQADHGCECFKVNDNIFAGSSFSSDVDATTEENITSFLTFRISVKCSGKVKRWLELRRLSRDIAWRISKATCWKVDLHNPDFEICIHISDEYVTAGVPLTKFPLSRRSYILNPGLRSTIAWIMSYLAKIKPGEIVLDPMCGKATVLIEAFSEFEALLYLGSDSDSDQLTAAQQNITKLKVTQPAISLVKADGLNLPYRDGCVDVVVCDAPFNQKHIIHQESSELFYFQFLKEIKRVLVPNGRCVLLISQELKETVFHKLISSQSNDSGQGHEDQADCLVLVPFICSSTHAVQLGETQAFIIVLNK